MNKCYYEFTAPVMFAVNCVDWLKMSTELICLLPNKFHLLEDLHISLSRTCVIRHHWIETLVESLRIAFTSISA